MNRTYLEKRIVFMSDLSGTRRLVLCPTCKINTVHRLNGDAFLCSVCDTATTTAELDARPEWKAEDILKREG